MKRTRSLFAIAIVGTVLISLVPAVANAGSYETCNDDPVVLTGDPTTHIGSISFPKNSTEREDLINVLGHWNSLRGMYIEFDPVEWFSGTYAYDNDKNEIVVHDISGYGLTTIQLDACFWWFESQHIQEFDIEVDSNTSWDLGSPPENSNDGLPSLRYTIIHELGHALGLLHTNNDPRASVMKQSPKGESWSGGAGPARVHPFGDDTHTSRFLYPYSTTHRDIATSAFRVDPSGNVQDAMADTTITVRRGGTFPATASLHNVGTATEKFDIVYVLSTNDNISTSDTVVASGTATAPPGWFATFTWSARVPNSLANGTYSVGMILDPNNSVSELREENNTVLLQTKVRVTGP